MNWCSWGIFWPPTDSFSWSSWNRLQKSGLRSSIWNLSWHSSSQAIVALGLALYGKMLFELCHKQDWVSLGVSNDVLARARAVWESQEGNRSSSRRLNLLERISEMSPDKRAWLYSASNHSRRSLRLVFGYRHFQAWREAFWEVGIGCQGGILANQPLAINPLQRDFHGGSRKNYQDLW